MKIWIFQQLAMNRIIQVWWRLLNMQSVEKNSNEIITRWLIQFHLIELCEWNFFSLVAREYSDK